MRPFLLPNYEEITIPTFYHFQVFSCCASGNEVQCKCRKPASIGHN